MVEEVMITLTWARSGVRSRVVEEILRFAQNDSLGKCHSERSEESPVTFG